MLIFSITHGVSRGSVSSRSASWLTQNHLLSTYISFLIIPRPIGRVNDFRFADSLGSYRNRKKQMIWFKDWIKGTRLDYEWRRGLPDDRLRLFMTRCVFLVLALSLIAWLLGARSIDYIVGTGILGMAGLIWRYYSRPAPRE